jgi:hypothetical protein
MNFAVPLLTAAAVAVAFPIYPVLLAHWFV